VLIWGRDSVQVLDAGSGKVLFHLDGRVNDASLSPDGRFAVVSQAGQDRVHDLESGATYQVSLSSWAWTYDDRAVFGVQGSTLQTCVLSTGRCQDVSVPRKAGSVRYPGVSYES
jgi:predicted heme/steroid binding protein